MGTISIRGCTAIIRGCTAIVAAGAALLAFETAIGASGPTHLTLQHGTISLDADSYEYDVRAQRMTMTKAVITQGDLRVTADRAEATGVDSDNSRWTFTNNVHISSTQLGVLTSDSATVDFRDNRLESALVTGHPAEFEQTSSKTGALARGHADSIRYTVATDTVRLTGNATLQYPGTDTSAAVVVYDIRDQKLQFAAGAGGGARVHIVTTPQNLTKPGTAPSVPARPRRGAPRSASGPP
ncbi:MAG: lipopolysaccharide transport periplasmic protein LptA [Steroidobacteraceae bacterium]